MRKLTVDMKDVAARAGVAPITVSRVVRNAPNVTPEVRQRVERAIEELNYIPNGAARGLKGAGSGLLAVLIGDITSPFFAAVARGADDEARRLGRSLVLCNTDEDSTVEAKSLRAMGVARVEGVILVPTPAALPSLKKNLPATTPVVFLDRELDDALADAIICDTESGVRTLTKHLLSLGCSRIAMVGGKPSISTWYRRIEGFRSAMSEAGIDVNEDWIVDGNYDRDSGASAVQHLLSLPATPETIIAANAQVALGALDALTALGRSVPGDIGLASIDDPLPECSFWPRITAVSQPGYEMGKRAVTLLVSRIQGPKPSERQVVVFQSSLLIGKSCGEP